MVELRSDVPSVPFGEGGLVVGDLHLDVFDDECVDRCCAWLAGLEGVPQLIILGDLFEFWVGDRQLSIPGASRIAAALKALCARGTSVHVLHGNRDFLLGAQFASASGVSIWPRGLVGESRWGRTLFLHGDELCTSDVGYQRLRLVLRSRWLTWLVRRLPLTVQLALARRLRRASVRAQAHKQAPVVVMDPQAAEERSEANLSELIVCGHAHKAQDQSLGKVRWLVVDAWGGERDCVRADEGQMALTASGA